jgi:hypothetical protein
VPLLRAQNDPGKGWVEGAIVTVKGKPACGASSSNMPLDYCGGTTITLRPREGNGVKTDTDVSKAGFYTFRNLKPGVYEVFIDKTVQKDRDEILNYRPQHIFGLIVKPDECAVLNIAVHEGEALEEVGKPDVASEKAIILADELALLRKEIEELKKK